MAQTVRLSGIQRDAGTGRVTIQFGKVGMEFENVAAVRAWVQELDSQDNARRLCVAYLVERSNNLSDLTSVRNRNFIVDMTNANPVRVV